MNKQKLRYIILSLLVIGGLFAGFKYYQFQRDQYKKIQMLESATNNIGMFLQQTFPFESELFIKKLQEQNN